MVVTSDQLKNQALKSLTDRIHVYGGVRINIADGVTNLLDLRTAVDTGLDLTDLGVGDTPIHYITLDKPCSGFMLTTVTIAYVDTANADDLANIHFFEGASAADDVSAGKLRYQSGAIAEGPHIRKDINIPFKLDILGRVYFNTDWTTALISCGAATEYFMLRIDGYVLDN